MIARDQELERASEEVVAACPVSQSLAGLEYRLQAASRSLDGVISIEANMLWFGKATEIIDSLPKLSWEVKEAKVALPARFQQEALVENANERSTDNLCKLSTDRRLARVGFAIGDSAVVSRFSEATVASAYDGRGSNADASAIEECILSRCVAEVVLKTGEIHIFGSEGA